MQTAHTLPANNAPNAIKRRIRNPKPKKTAAELRDEFYTAPDNSYLDRETTAAGISRSVGWMELKATKGGGIPYLKQSGKCLYLKSDALAWLKANSVKVASTSELPPDKQSGFGKKSSKKTETEV